MKTILRLAVLALIVGICLLARPWTANSTQPDQKFQARTDDRPVLRVIHHVEESRVSNERIEPQVKTGKIRTVRRLVTAYNSVPEQTDSTPCISADGSDICKLYAQGEITCASTDPFGTRLFIPGIGVCTVHDRLSSKYSHRVDVYFGGRDRVKAAKEWGIKALNIAYVD